MKKLFISLVTTATLLLASSHESAYYDIGFSVVGTIAKASVDRQISDNTYLITLKAEATGIAAKLTKHKKESYISQGSIKNGELIPDVLVIFRKNDIQEKYTIFRFNHEKKTIMVDSAETKEQRETSLDVATLHIITTTKDVFTASTHENDYYASNDIVSLFFNGKHYTTEMKGGDQKMFHAVGIKTDDGELMINLPTSKEYIANAKEPTVFSISVSKDIFDDANGQLIVKMDPDNFPQSAIMNNVAMYGDVTSTRVYNTVATTK